MLPKAGFIDMLLWYLKLKLGTLQISSHHSFLVSKTNTGFFMPKLSSSVLLGAPTGADSKRFLRLSRKDMHWRKSLSRFWIVQCSISTRPQLAGFSPSLSLSIHSGCLLGSFPSYSWAACQQQSGVRAPWITASRKSKRLLPEDPQ